jgi:hypothetical protein
MPPAFEPFTAVSTTEKVFSFIIDLYCIIKHVGCVGLVS